MNIFYYIILTGWSNHDHERCHKKAETNIFGITSTETFNTSDANYPKPLNLQKFQPTFFAFLRSFGFCIFNISHQAVLPEIQKKLDRVIEITIKDSSSSLYLSSFYQMLHVWEGYKVAQFCPIEKLQSWPPILTHTWSKLTVWHTQSDIILEFVLFKYLFWSFRW